MRDSTGPTQRLTLPPDPGHDLLERRIQRDAIAPTAIPAVRHVPPPRHRLQWLRERRARKWIILFDVILLAGFGSFAYARFGTHEATPSVVVPQEATPTVTTLPLIPTPVSAGLTPSGATPVTRSRFDSTSTSVPGPTVDQGSTPVPDATDGVPDPTATNPTVTDAPPPGVTSAPRTTAAPDVEGNGN